jgi:hypothetical protein
MVVRLETSEAFVLLLKNKDYDIAGAVEKCREAAEHHLPMYLIAPSGANVTHVMNFPWRLNGIFLYQHEAELMQIMQKIRMDLKWIRSIGI